jgi:aryl-alcohol dehydrogenase-like predicted oxidoreductase
MRVSSIGLGCVTFGREIEENTAFDIMDHAVANGINLFDTAEAYAAGASEEVVGNWLQSRGRREEIVLATKVAGSLTRAHVLSSAEASLRRLRTDHVDLFQVHRWDRDVPLDETLATLDTLVRQGKALHVGCSNYTAEQLGQALERQEASGWASMVSVQPNYNLVAREIESALLPLCAARNVGVISYSPLGAGFLTGKYRQGGPVPAGTRFDIIPGHQDIYFREEYFRVVENLRFRADGLGVPMAQLAMAWVFSRPGITSVLIGARTIEHVDQAFRAETLKLEPNLLTSLAQV